MKTKFLTLFCGLCFAISLWASDTQVDGIYYDFDDSNNTASVTYQGTSCYEYHDEYSGSVIIPSSVTYNGKNYSVTSIGVEAFYVCSGLTSVTIGNSVTSIGNSAFGYCTSLTSITIPNSVTSIGEAAFKGCEGLTSFTIPNSVTSIEYGTFYNCTGLTSITIPNSVTSIGEEAFYECSSLASITIPNSIISIEHGTFNGCSGLTSIEIPNSVTSIGDYAFRSCYGLTSIIIPNSVTTIGEGAFQFCTDLISVTIPNSITSIGEDVFYQCYGLTSVTIPNSVTSIGEHAFQVCRSLTSVTIPNSVTSIEDGAFFGCTGLTEVTLGANLKKIGCNAFKNDTLIESITSYATIPPTVCETTFDGLSKEYIYLYVPEESVNKYQKDPNWNKFDIKTKSASTTVVPNDSVFIIPSSNEAIFLWPADNQAYSYSLEITKDGITLYTYKFNSLGQLTGIAYAPGRNGRHDAPAAILSATGWQFTVTSLDAASRYNYTLDVNDTPVSKIKTYSGEFTTTGIASALDNILPDASTTKFFRDGQLYIQRNGIIYDARGARVE